MKVRTLTSALMTEAIAAEFRIFIREPQQILHSMFGTSKGITPVIAIVLLLLVTVGAVGVVYTQFQGLVGDGPDADFLDADGVDISMSSTVSHDPINLTLRNNGDDEYDLQDDFRVDVSVPGEGRVPLEDAVVFDEFEDESPQQCLEEGNEAEGHDSEDYTSFGPGDSIACEPDIDDLSGPEEATFYLVLDSADDEVTDVTCDPSTSTSATC